VHVTRPTHHVGAAHAAAGLMPRHSRLSYYTLVSQYDAVGVTRTVADGDGKHPKKEYNVTVKICRLTNGPVSHPNLKANPNAMNTCALGSSLHRCIDIVITKRQCITKIKY
jgi:hypothetical protein